MPRTSGKLSEEKSLAPASPPSNHWLFPHVYKPHQRPKPSIIAFSNRQKIFCRELCYEFMQELDNYRSALQERSNFRTDFPDKLMKAVKVLGSIVSLIVSNGALSEAVDLISDGLYQISDLSSEKRKKRHFQDPINEILVSIDSVLIKLEITVENAARIAARYYTYGIHHICRDEGEVRILAAIGARRMMYHLIEQAKNAQAKPSFQFTPDLLVMGLYTGKSGQGVDSWFNTTIKTPQFTGDSILDELKAWMFAPTAEAIYKQAIFVVETTVIVKNENTQEDEITQQHDFYKTDQTKLEGKGSEQYAPLGVVCVPSEAALPPDYKKFSESERQIEKWEACSYKPRYVNTDVIKHYISAMKVHYESGEHVEIEDFNTCVRGWAVFDGELSGTSDEHIELHLGNFNQVDFSNSHLSYCILQECRNAYFTGASFSHVKAPHADHEEALHIDFTGTALDHAVVSNSNLHGAIFHQAKFRYARVVNSAVCHLKGREIQSEGTTYDQISKRCPKDEPARIWSELTPRIQPLAAMQSPETSRAAFQYAERILRQQHFHQLLQTFQYEYKVNREAAEKRLNEIVSLVTNIDGDEQKQLIGPIISLLVDIQKLELDDEIRSMQEQKNVDNFSLQLDKLEDVFKGEYRELITLCKEINLSGISQYKQNKDKILSFLVDHITKQDNPDIYIVFAFWEHVRDWNDAIIKWPHSNDEEIEDKLHDARLNLKGNSNALFSHLLLVIRNLQMGRKSNYNNARKELKMALYELVRLQSLENQTTKNTKVIALWLPVTLYLLDQLCKKWLHAYQDDLTQRQLIDKLYTETETWIMHHCDEYAIGFSIQAGNNFANHSDYHQAVLHLTKSVAHSKLSLPDKIGNSGITHFSKIRPSFVSQYLEQSQIFFALEQQIKLLESLNQKLPVNFTRVSRLLQLFIKTVGYLLNSGSNTLGLLEQVKSAYKKNEPTIIRYFEIIELGLGNSSDPIKFCYEAYKLVALLEQHKYCFSQSLIEYLASGRTTVKEFIKTQPLLIKKFSFDLNLLDNILKFAYSRKQKNESEQQDLTNTEQNIKLLESDQDKVNPWPQDLINTRQASFDTAAQLLTQGFNSRYNKEQKAEHSVQSRLDCSIKELLAGQQAYQQSIYEYVSTIVQDCIVQIGEPPQPIAIIAGGKVSEIGLYPGAVFPITLLTAASDNLQSYYTTLTALIQARLERVGHIVIDVAPTGIPIYTPEEYVKENFNALSPVNPNWLGHPVIFLYDSHPEDKSSPQTCYETLKKEEIKSLLEKELYQQSEDLIIDCLSHFDQAFHQIRPALQFIRTTKPRNSAHKTQLTDISEEKIKATEVDHDLKQDPIPLKNTSVNKAYTLFEQRKATQTVEQRQCVNDQPSDGIPSEDISLGQILYPKEEIAQIDIEQCCLIPLVQWCKSLGFKYKILESEPLTILSELIKKFSHPEQEYQDNYHALKLHPDFLKDVQVALIFLMQQHGEHYQRQLEQYGIGYRWVNNSDNISMSQLNAVDEKKDDITQEKSVQVTEDNHFMVPEENLSITEKQRIELIKYVLMPAYETVNRYINEGYRIYLCSALPSHREKHLHSKDILIVRASDESSYKIYYVLKQTEAYDLDNPISIGSDKDNTDALRLKNILDQTYQEQHHKDEPLNYRCQEQTLLQLVNAMVEEKGGYTCKSEAIPANYDPIMEALEDKLQHIIREIWPCYDKAKTQRNQDDSQAQSQLQNLADRMAKAAIIQEYSKRYGIYEENRFAQDYLKAHNKNPVRFFDHYVGQHCKHIIRVIQHRRFHLDKKALVAYHLRFYRQLNRQFRKIYRDQLILILRETKDPVGKDSLLHIQNILLHYPESDGTRPIDIPNDPTPYDLYIQVQQEHLDHGLTLSQPLEVIVLQKISIGEYQITFIDDKTQTIRKIPINHKSYSKTYQLIDDYLNQVNFAHNQRLSRNEQVAHIELFDAIDELIRHIDNPLYTWHQELHQLIEEKPSGDEPFKILWVDPITHEKVSGYLKENICNQLIGGKSGQSTFNPDYSPKYQSEKARHMERKAEQSQEMEQHKKAQKQEGIGNSRVVIPIAFDASQPLQIDPSVKAEAYCKAYPDMQAVQDYAQSIRHSISGVRLPAILCRFAPAKGEPYPVLISKALPEKSLYEQMIQYDEAGRVQYDDSGQPKLRNKADILSIESRLDPFYFTLKYYETLLIRPEDGKLDNDGTETFTDHNGQPATRLVSIDSDHAFVDLFTYEEDKKQQSHTIHLNVKTMVYTLTLMDKAMDDQARALFLSLDPTAIMTRCSNRCSYYLMADNVDDILATFKHHKNILIKRNGHSYELHYAFKQPIDIFKEPDDAEAVIEYKMVSINASRHQVLKNALDALHQAEQFTNRLCIDEVIIVHAEKIIQAENGYTHLSELETYQRDHVSNNGLFSQAEASEIFMKHGSFLGCCLDHHAIGNPLYRWHLIRYKLAKYPLMAPRQFSEKVEPLLSRFYPKTDPTKTILERFDEAMQSSNYDEILSGKNRENIIGHYTSTRSPKQQIIQANKYYKDVQIPTLNRIIYRFETEQKKINRIVRENHLPSPHALLETLHAFRYLVENHQFIQKVYESDCRFIRRIPSPDILLSRLRMKDLHKYIIQRYKDSNLSRDEKSKIITAEFEKKQKEILDNIPLNHYQDCESLNLSGFTTLRDDQLKNILKQCPKIIQLNVSGCTQLTEKSIAKITYYCEYLRVLNISSLPNLRRLALQTRGQDYLSLEQLIVKDCPILKKIGIDAPNLSVFASTGSDQLCRVHLGSQTEDLADLETMLNPNTERDTIHTRFALFTKDKCQLIFNILLDRLLQGNSIIPLEILYGLSTQINQLQFANLIDVLFKLLKKGQWQPLVKYALKITNHLADELTEKQRQYFINRFVTFTKQNDFDYEESRILEQRFTWFSDVQIIDLFQILVKQIKPYREYHMNQYEVDPLGDIYLYIRIKYTKCHNLWLRLRSLKTVSIGLAKDENKELVELFSELAEHTRDWTSEDGHLLWIDIIRHSSWIIERIIANYQPEVVVQAILSRLDPDFPNETAESTFQALVQCYDYFPQERFSELVIVPLMKILKSGEKFLLKRAILGEYSFKKGLLRSEAITALGQIPKHVVGQPIRDIVLFLINIAKNDRYVNVRNAAMSTLTNLSHRIEDDQILDVFDFVLYGIESNTLLPGEDEWSEKWSLRSAVFALLKCIFHRLPNDYLVKIKDKTFNIACSDKDKAKAIEVLYELFLPLVNNINHFDPIDFIIKLFNKVGSDYGLKYFIKNLEKISSRIENNQRLILFQWLRNRAVTRLNVMDQVLAIQIIQSLRKPWEENQFHDLITYLIDIVKQSNHSEIVGHAFCSLSYFFKEMSDQRKKYVIELLIEKIQIVRRWSFEDVIDYLMDSGYIDGSQFSKLLNVLSNMLAHDPYSYPRHVFINVINKHVDKLSEEQFKNMVMILITTAHKLDYTYNSYMLENIMINLIHLMSRLESDQFKEMISIFLDNDVQIVKPVQKQYSSVYVDLNNTKSYYTFNELFANCCNDQIGFVLEALLEKIKDDDNTGNAYSLRKRYQTLVEYSNQVRPNDNEAIIRVFIDKLEPDIDRDIHERALWALSNLSDFCIDQPSDNFIQFLLNSATRSISPKIREYAVLLVGKLADSISKTKLTKVIEIIANRACYFNEPTVRANACYALGQLARHIYLNNQLETLFPTLLVNIQYDRNPTARKNAILALEQLPHQLLLPDQYQNMIAILERSAESDKDMDVQIQASGTLSQIKKPLSHARPETCRNSESKVHGHIDQPLDEKQIELDLDSKCEQSFSGKNEQSSPLPSLENAQKDIDQNANSVKPITSITSHDTDQKESNTTKEVNASFAPAQTPTDAHEQPQTQNSKPIHLSAPEQYESLTPTDSGEEKKQAEVHYKSHQVGDVRYNELMILKIWTQYAQQKSLRFCHSAVEGQIEDDLFRPKMRLKNESALLINSDDEMYQTKSFTGNKTSLSFCSSVNYSSIQQQETGMSNIKEALNQFSQWQKNNQGRHECSTRHTILFPYHADENHWCLGFVELQFSRRKLQSKGTVRIYDPMGPLRSGVSEISPQAHQMITNSIRNVFQPEHAFQLEYQRPELPQGKNFDRQQPRGNGDACGVIVADWGKDLIDGDIERISKGKFSDRGIRKLRLAHLNEAQDERFLELQKESAHVDHTPSGHEPAKASLEHVYPVLKEALLTCDAVDRESIIRAFRLLHQAIDEKQNSVILDKRFNNLKGYLFTCQGKLKQKVPEANCSLFRVFFNENQVYEEGARGLFERLAEKVSHSEKSPYKKFSCQLSEFLKETGLLLQGVLYQPVDDGLALTCNSQHVLQRIHQVLAEKIIDNKSVLGPDIQKLEKQAYDNDDLLTLNNIKEMRDSITEIRITVDKNQRPWVFSYTVPLSIIEILEKVLESHLSVILDARHGEQPLVSPYPGSFVQSWSSMPEQKREANNDQNDHHRSTEHHI